MTKTKRTDKGRDKGKRQSAGWKHKLSAPDYREQTEQGRQNTQR